MTQSETFAACPRCGKTLEVAGAAFCPHCGSPVAAAQAAPVPEGALALLEKAERQTDPQDRRKTLVRITPAGQHTLQECEQALNAYFARVMGRIEPAQLAQMMALGDVLLSALEAETAATAAAKEECLDGKDF